MNWRRIPGFSRYEVSDTGEVRRAERIGQWLPGPCGRWMLRGYPFTDMTNDEGVEKKIGVHRVVALAFLGPPNGRHVRHLDGSRDNCALSNLAYGTPKENEADKARHGRKVEGEKHPKAVLTVEAVREIVSIKRMQGLSNEKLGKRYGVSKFAIHDIFCGKSWRSVTGYRRTTSMAGNA